MRTSSHMERRQSCENLRSFTCKTSRFQRERDRGSEIVEGLFVFGFWRFRVLERHAVCRLFVFPPHYIETLLALLMGVHGIFVKLVLSWTRGT
jgi:hypothetical protein